MKLINAVENFKDAYQSYIEKCDFNKKRLIKLLGEDSYLELSNRDAVVVGFLYGDEIMRLFEYKFKTGELVITATTDFGDDWKELDFIDTDEKALAIIRNISSQLHFTGLK